LKSKIRIFGISLTIALCAFVYAHAATRYVSHSGNNTFPYTTWETAANTIETANLATLPGDTMFVDTGSFYLAARPFLQPNVTMRGKGMDSTSMFGADSLGIMFRPYDFVVVEDIHFVGHGSLYAFSKYATEPHQSFFCHRCKFSNFASSILAFDDNREIVVRDCWFEKWGQYALYLTGPGDLTIENNTFYTLPDAIRGFANFIGNTGTITLHKNIFVGGGWTGIQGGQGRLDVRNNLFYRNKWLELVQITAARDIVFAQNSFFLTHNDFGRANDILVLYLDEIDTCLIYNNVFAGYQPRLVLNDNVTNDPLFKIAYNCFYAVAPFDREDHIWVSMGQFLVDSLQSNVYADPMFVDPWNGDLHLQKNSPCIDAGAPWVLDVDGTRSDIGAFGGPDGEFYIYQDYPPQQPQKFDAWRSNDRVIVQWQRNSESDLEYYALFRSSESVVPLDSNHMLAYFNRSGKIVGGNAHHHHRAPFGFSDSGKHVDPYEVIMPYADSTVLMTYFGDYSTSADSSYYYAIVAVDSSGLVSSASTAGVGAGLAPVQNTDDREGPPYETSIIPQDGMTYELEPNYPNPFNAVTAIVYNLPNIGAQPAPVRLAIYNSIGQRVRTLVDDGQMPGRYIIYWNIDDDYGRQVASGIYFYRLEVSGIEFVKSGKMILMK
jgi:hypothetical protein